MRKSYEPQRANKFSPGSGFRVPAVDDKRCRMAARRVGMIIDALNVRGAMAAAGSTRPRTDTDTVGPSCGPTSPDPEVRILEVRRGAAAVACRALAATAAGSISRCSLISWR